MNNDAKEKSRAEAPAKVNESPRTRWILVSFFAPQYWERKMAEPLQTPKNNTLIRKNIWFPSATAAMEDSPSCPIIRVSTKERELVSRLWKTTGKAMVTIF
jgi:hypothetical protein